MRDRFSVDRSIFRFFHSTFQRKTLKSPRRRKLAFDPLEERTLLTAVGWSDAVSTWEPVETAEVGELVESAADDRFDIELEVLESGAARYATQTGVRYSTSTSYCAVPDPVYLDLLDRALARWEEAISEGTPDVEGVPNAADDENETARFVDDIYVTFGFSDSYASASSGLGSAYDYAWRRDDGAGLPATGSLVFNAKYFSANPSETVRNVF